MPKEEKPMNDNDSGMEGMMVLVTCLLGAEFLWLLFH